MGEIGEQLGRHLKVGLHKIKTTLMILFRLNAVSIITTKFIKMIQTQNQNLILVTLIMDWTKVEIPEAQEALVAQEAT
ncbi:hypothetical protein PSI9734_01144 [Pseudidiomarina piscicola]|uniref:Uncharacterized protein n=1 Tax=Pseudidiomarina piscicola TaxID=2614830 RepID=A0A6S6WMT7_9GAMM|nr:hypothetical protein PSI9734_01144 [Pseudidiomarina piscicola]VZT40209.1 hypothetical protein PSI9734_01144 [Pseudomonas aeruginosa]